MRYGLNSFLVNSGFTTQDLPMIAQFKSYGADVIEMAVGDPSAVDAAALKKALCEIGMENNPICGVFSPDRDLRGTPEQQETSIKYIGELIDLAEAIGTKVVCGPMYSSVGRCNAHTPEEREEQLKLVAKNLEPLCDCAEKAGITLAFEPLNRFETDLINTVDQAKDLVARVGSPVLKIHVDTFHMGIEENNSAQAIRDAGDLIAHVHACGNNRGIPGQDQTDWTGILGALHAIGYEGDLVIESFTMDNKIIARAASIWRELFESAEALSVQGIAFLKQKWAETSPA